MIVGIGTDLVETARMQDLHARFGNRLAQRLLGPLELADFVAHAHPASFLARRFAAKEAALKALGTGLRDGMRWRDVQVTHTNLGQPQLLWAGRAQARLLAFGEGIRAHLSISDERGHALAFVVLEIAP